MQSSFNHISHTKESQITYKNFFSSNLNGEESSFHKYFSEAITKDNIFPNSPIDSFDLGEPISNKNDYIMYRSADPKIYGFESSLNKINIDHSLTDTSMSFENFYLGDIGLLEKNSKNTIHQKKIKVRQSTEEMLLEKAKIEKENLKLLKKKNEKTLDHLKNTKITTPIKGKNSKITTPIKGIKAFYPPNFLHKKRKTESTKKIKVLPTIKKEKLPQKNNILPKSMSINIESELSKLSRKIECITISKSTDSLLKKPICVTPRIIPNSKAKISPKNNIKPKCSLEKNMTYKVPISSRKVGSDLNSIPNKITKPFKSFDFSNQVSVVKNRNNLFKTPHNKK